MNSVNIQREGKKKTQKNKKTKGRELSSTS
jgi:hypothetical protein